MAELTITHSASATVDGLTSSASSSFLSTVRDYMEQTRDVDGSRTQVYDGGWAFCIVINAGEVDIIAETAYSSDYAVFVVPPGAHAVLPAAANTIAGVAQASNGLWLYTAGSATRAVVLIGMI